jgi:putative flippase GtrA
VGVVSTLADWGIFYLAALVLGIHYQVAVAASLILTTILHYSLNKVFTFRCTSREIVRQLGAHVTVSAVYLLLTMGMMYLLVDVLHLHKMVAKMGTTVVMMVVSYLLHSRVTYNKAFFAQR